MLSAALRNRQTKPGGDRVVVGGIAPVDVVVEDLRFEHFCARRREDVVDLISLAAAPERVACSDVFDVRMKDAESVHQHDRCLDGAFAREVLDDRIFGSRCAEQSEPRFSPWTAGTYDPGEY